MIQETALPTVSKPESHTHESPPGLVDPDEDYIDEHMMIKTQSQ